MNLGYTRFPDKNEGHPVKFEFELINNFKYVSNMACSTPMLKIAIYLKFKCNRVLCIFL